MAKFARAIATLHTDTGLPEDRVVNVMHFEGDDSQTWEEDADDLAGRIHDFYVGIQEELSVILDGTLDVEIYNLADAEPRIPVYSETWTDLVPDTSALPSEVALCVSFQATPASGVNQARRRGRIYVGPLGSDQVASVGGRTAPTAALITNLGNHFSSLVIGPDAGDFRLAVFSPTILAATSSLADAFSDVTDVWIDNAFDTQRRRGTTATTRTHFTPS